MYDCEYDWDTTESLRVVENTLIAVVDESGDRVVVKWSLNEDHDPETFYTDAEILGVLPVKNPSNHVAVVGK